MKLPYDLLRSTYVAPKVFLCETDKTKICELKTIGLNGTFKFNSYSEISFDVPRILLDTITGESYVHPYYDKIEAVRLLSLPGFGYFEIQTPTVNGDGIQETKSISAFSLEYTLSHKYLENFIINNQDIEGNIGGGDPSVISKLYDDYADGKISYEEYNQQLTEITNGDPLVQFYDKDNPSHSLLHLALQKAYGWTIGHVDAALATQTRSFNVDRESIYDFLMNDVAQTFKCYFVFDTVNNTVNVYSEANSIKFNGDGSTTTFMVIPIFTDLGDVTINGYRTLDYKYDNTNGIIQFTEPPEVGSIIEVNDGAQAEWQTNVFVSFDNIASQMEYSYEADNIKTCLSVTGADDLDIRDVNLGLKYVMDLSYFNTPEWMGQDLYEAYNEYTRIVNEKTPRYTELLKEYNELWMDYFELHNRTTTDVSNEEGYIPKIYLTELKLDHFKQMLQKYYCDKNIDGVFPDSELNIVNQIKDDFKFLGDSIIIEYIDFLQSKTNPSEDDIKEIEDKTYKILKLIWGQFGISILNIYVNSYTNIQQLHLTDEDKSDWSRQVNGFAHKDADGKCDNYCFYWSNYIMLSSCQTALNERSIEATKKQKAMDDVNAKMAEISKEVAMENNFTETQLTRLSAFIREDEYSDDNFITTESDTIDDIFKTKKELLQCGKIELSKLCAPILSFTAQLANIYALEEFKPIVDQFQLGNLINISLRPGFLKKARLMEVNINFDDFSDFSCTFGDLISTKSQADIHADLLQQAASAGKSVASNSSYWDKGADMATKTDIRIQNGLLDANTRIKAIDGSQGVEIDKNGIHLKMIDKETGEIDPKQAWLVNNMMCYTDDNWKTTKAVFGEYTVDDTTYWGLLAEGVIAGYIEGSTIVGSEIKAGDRGDKTYNFSVSPDGHIIAQSGTIAGWEIDDKSFRAGELGQADSMWMHRTGTDEKASIGGSDSIDKWSIGIGSNFGVTNSGKLYSNAGQIAGWGIGENQLSKQMTENSTDYQVLMQALNSGSTSDAFAVKSKKSYASTWDTQFAVNYEGKLTAKNADITGKIVTDDITATNGTVGGWSINDSKIYAGDANTKYCAMQKPTSNSTIVFAAGGSSANYTDSPFRVTAAGKLYATDADISGKVTATSGEIAGFSIATDSQGRKVLQTSNQNIILRSDGTGKIGDLTIGDGSASFNGTIYADQVKTRNGAAISNAAGTYLNTNFISAGSIGAGKIADSAIGYNSDCVDGSSFDTHFNSIYATKAQFNTLSADVASIENLTAKMITTDNFSSKTLSTGKLTVDNNCKIGKWTITSGAIWGQYTGYSVSLAQTGITVSSSSSQNTCYWHNVVKAADSASDRRLKNSISDFGEDFDIIFDKLKPVQFRFNNDPNHLNLGFIAQDVEEAFNSVNINDFNGLYLDPRDDTGVEYYHLLKTEFIALNTWQIQKLKTKVSNLQEEVELLKQQIASLK